MKDRPLWVPLGVLLVLAAAVYCWRMNAAGQGSRHPVDRPTADPTAVAPVVKAGSQGHATVLPDGKTVDMSTGAPVVRDDARNRAKLEADLAEMRAAAQNVSFGAPVPPKSRDAAVPIAPVAAPVGSKP